jgi:hypothetical protein
MSTQHSQRYCQSTSVSLRRFLSTQRRCDVICERTPVKKNFGTIKFLELAISLKLLRVNLLNLFRKLDRFITANIFFTDIQRGVAFKKSE